MPKVQYRGSKTGVRFTSDQGGTVDLHGIGRNLSLYVETPSRFGVTIKLDNQDAALIIEALAQHLGPEVSE